MAGIALGLAYGWILDPLRLSDTTPASLRADYRTDYVLMVAEAYHAQQDSEVARRQLAVFGGQSPAAICGQALQEARARLLLGKRPWHCCRNCSVPCSRLLPTSAPGGHAMKRFPWEILLALGAGLGAGLYYAWVVSPLRWSDITPDTLRADFKDQFRLAIASAYAATGNLDRAQSSPGFARRCQIP